MGNQLDSLLCLPFAVLCFVCACVHVRVCAYVCKCMSLCKCCACMVAGIDSPSVASPGMTGAEQEWVECSACMLACVRACECQGEVLGQTLQQFLAIFC